MPENVSYPTHLNLELTSMCNLNCCFCARAAAMRLGTRPPGNIEDAVLDLALKMYADIASHADDVQFHPVGLGEPLLYQGFFDVLDRISEMVPNARILANTNGILMTAAIGEKILESPLDALIVSLNATNAQDYNDLHGADAFYRVEQNISDLLRMRIWNNPRITIQLLDIHVNREKADQFSRLWLGRGADEVLVRDFAPIDATMKHGLFAEEIDHYYQLCGPTERMERFPCPALFRSCMVDWEGFVYPCCYGTIAGRKSDLCLGNIKDHSILEIYSDGVRPLQKQHLAGRWDDIEACSGCTFWMMWNREEWLSHLPVSDLD